jgi:Cu-processing system permease protein
MDFKAIWDIGKQELMINIRNRWTLLFALVFGVLVTGLAYFGMQIEGYSGMQSFMRTSASILNLVLYIVPLVALTMGTLSFTGDKGSLELLFAQPLLRAEVVVGKWLGLFFSLALATWGGFAVAGSLLLTTAGGEGILQYGVFVLLSLLLGMAFLTIALLTVSMNHRKAKTFGFALFLWFFFVLFYDVLSLGLSLLLKGESANAFLFLSLFGNPVDMVRVATLILLGSTTVFGASGAALIRFLGGETLSVFLLIAGLVGWIVVPLAIATRIMNRQDI